MESQLQQHGCRYFAQRPHPPQPPDHGGGIKRSKFNFFRAWSGCISS